MPVREVTFEEISFSYDSSLAEGVTTETVPPIELFDGNSGTMPEHVQFLFAGYILPETSQKSHIHVYPLSDLDPNVDHVWTVVARLRQLLADRPAEVPAGESGLLVLPLLGARQEMHAQMAYLDFQNGTWMS